MQQVNFQSLNFTIMNRINMKYAIALIALAFSCNGLTTDLNMMKQEEKKVQNGCNGKQAETYSPAIPQATITDGNGVIGTPVLGKCCLTEKEECLEGSLPHVYADENNPNSPNVDVTQPLMEAAAKTTVQNGKKQIPEVVAAEQPIVIAEECPKDSIELKNILKRKYVDAFGEFEELCGDDDKTLDDFEEFFEKQKKDGCGLSYSSDGAIDDECTFLHAAVAYREEDIVTLLLELGADVTVQSEKRGRTPLHLAAMRGQLGMVKILAKQIIKKGRKGEKEGINQRDMVGGHALHYAVQGGHLHVVRFLVEECGALVGVRDDNEATLLHVAMQCATDDLTNYLVSKIEDHEREQFMNAQEKRGVTALHFAASLGRMDAVKLLLRHAVNAGLTNQYGCTAADVARAKGYDDIAECIDPKQAKQ